MAVPQPIGIVIRRARERKRWTQRDLAEAVGVSRATVDAWENGRSRPRNRAGALEEVLGISLSGEPVPAVSQGPLAGLYPPVDDWEAAVLADDGLSDDWKRDLITASRDARARYAARRAARHAAQAREAAS